MPLKFYPFYTKKLVDEENGRNILQSTTVFLQIQNTTFLSNYWTLFYFTPDSRNNLQKFVKSLQVQTRKFAKSFILQTENAFPQKLNFAEGTFAENNQCKLFLTFQRTFFENVFKRLKTSLLRKLFINFPT